MSAQHTQGKLKVFSTYAIPEIRDQDENFLFAAGSATPQSFCNARRLAACWNACEGIPTEDMEGKTIAEYVSQQAFITGMNPSQEGMDLGVKGLAAQMMAASFAGQFIGNGAVNYLEMSMLHPDVGPFTVTIQRTQGLTPAQKLKHAEAQRDELLEALREMTERIEGHPAYEAMTEEEENLTGGDTAELSYLARVGRTAIAKAEGK